MTNRIAAIREEKGIRLTELTRKAKTTPSQIQKLERGERRLTVEWMQRLGAALGVKPSELLSARDVEAAGSRAGSLVSLLESFPASQRGLAEELAGGFLEMLLRYQAALPRKDGGGKSREMPASPEQRDLAHTLIRMSRHLASTLGETPQRKRGNG